MRTIDADALRDKLQSLAYDDWNQGVSTSWANAYSECADIVDDMPTIEPQRKRGKWIKLFAWRYICSEFGDWWTDGKFHYCPNCGTQMEIQDETS